MPFNPETRLFVLTGAGISAESGLATYRDSGGLWSGHRVEEVATPEAWAVDPAFVWRFYSQRRREAAAAVPNAAHLALAHIEQAMPGRFFPCTQNVDELHEHAGSHNIHHMHGSLYHSRCERCNQPFPDQSLYEDPTKLPTCASCAHAIRPHIVWFGETPLELDRIYAELQRATTLLVVGTSGSVYPAAGFVQIANRLGQETIYTGPEPPLNAESFDRILLGPATQVIPSLL